MNLQNRVLSLFAASALMAGAAVALAEDKSHLAGNLEHYLPIRAALAGDSLDGAKTHAGELAKMDDKAVAKAAKALGEAKDLDAARKSFGDLSKLVIAEVEAASKKGEKLPALYVFECPMAKPYGKWVQETKEIGNPYMGSKMPTCGKLVASIEPPAADVYTCPMHPDVTASAPGKCPQCGMALHKKADDAGAAYTCPMHPDVKQATAGKCPKCGMALHKKADK